MYEGLYKNIIVKLLFRLSLWPLILGCFSRYSQFSRQKLRHIFSFTVSFLLVKNIHLRKPLKLIESSVLNRSDSLITQLLAYLNVLLNIFVNVYHPVVQKKLTDSICFNRFCNIQQNIGRNNVMLFYFVNDEFI